MTRIGRQVATTALAVMIASGFPLAQEGPAEAPPGTSDTRGSAPPPTTGAPQDRPEIQPRLIARQADAEQTRRQLRDLLDRHPPSLGQVLRLDPTLLTDAEYLAPYPDLAAFLAQHPEVAHNPGFYIGTAHEAAWERDPNAAAFRVWESLQQGFFIVLVFSVITGMLVWLVRTLVDYRRWVRLTKVQTDTHTKLLDRLTNHEDLLAYMQTTAGRRFLESAPIALDAASRPLGAPLNRILWSVQAGVVLALAGLGVLIVSRTALPEVAQGLWAIGILTLALGAGFALSAGVAYLLSSRLGLLDQRTALPAEPLGETGLPGGRG